MPLLSMSPCDKTLEPNVDWKGVLTRRNLHVVPGDEYFFHLSCMGFIKHAFTIDICKKNPDYGNCTNCFRCGKYGKICPYCYEQSTEQIETEAAMIEDDDERKGKEGDPFFSKLFTLDHAIINPMYLARFHGHKDERLRVFMKMPEDGLPEEEDCFVITPKSIDSKLRRRLQE